MVLLVGHNAPTEKIRHSEEDTTVNVDGNDVGSGTLYVTESCVLWLNPREEGIQLNYKEISLHAISRDLTSFPHEHLLLHYDGKLPGMNDASSQSDEDRNEDDMECPQDEEGTLTEIKFVPQNKESLQAMFNALSDCQVLHPDPNDDCISEDEFEDADEEEENGPTIFYGEEGLEHLTEEGQANLERFNNMLQAGQGQGDADIETRTSQITITNGHHDPDQNDQFHDADGMNE